MRKKRCHVEAPAVRRTGSALLQISWLFPIPSLMTSQDVMDRFCGSFPLQNKF
jgi:hypothetical protein